MNHYIVDREKLRRNGRVMSEVDTTVYLESDFDAERLRADTAERERNEALNRPNNVFKKMCDLAINQRNEAQSRLAAAEQRIAELVGLLSKAKLAVDDVAENCEDQTDWAKANSMHALSERIDAALNQKSEGESQ